jgi:hypothetical protein
VNKAGVKKDREFVMGIFAESGVYVDSCGKFFTRQQPKT